MVISLRKCLAFLRSVIVFIALTYLLYNFLGIFGEWITPVDHYKIPKGYAVKAFEDVDGQTSVDTSMGERLRFYYWYGE